MKRIEKLWIFILLGGIIAGCGSVSSPETAVNRLDVLSGMSQSQVDTVAAVLSTFPNKTQFSIAFIDDSKATYYGAIRKNDTLTTINNSKAVFEIGSLSKVFTSGVRADLAYQNKLKLDQSIHEYLDLPLNNGIEITFKQLSNHTSGLPRIPSGFVWESLMHMDNPYKDYNEQKLRKYLTEEMELQSEPGTAYHYSNIGAEY